MDTSSPRSSRGHSHLNGHRSIPPETLKAVVEASLKAVGQVKAIREAVQSLSRKQEEYEKHNDERWQALNARISQLESQHQDKAPPQNGVNLVNGHRHTQGDVSDHLEYDEDIINGQDDEIPTLTTFAPVQPMSTFGAPARYTSSPSDTSHVSHSHASHSQASPSSAVSSRHQAILSPVRQSASSPQSHKSHNTITPPAYSTHGVQAGPSTPYQSISPSSATPIQTKPFDIIPERLSAARGDRPDKDNDVEGYEAFIEEMGGSGKGKAKAKNRADGSLHDDSQDARGIRSGLKDVDIEDRQTRTPSASSPIPHRDSPELDVKGSNIGDQYKAIKAEHARLKAWERQLEKQAARQEEIKAIHLDHEEELEKRLQAVMKREDKVQRAEAVLEMRARGARPHEVEAAIYRRVEDARAIREECKRRAEELNEAEEAWCRAKKVDYVPVIKDGQWPFDIYPLDR